MKKNNGFTLAEVLITLAIIGIVAALTIPTLVQNYQERAWNTASQVFEKKLEEALKVMNTQASLAGYKTTEDFVHALSKHMKITKVCKSDNITSCFENEVFWGTQSEKIDITKMHKARHFGLDDWDTELIGLQFANGTIGIIAYDPKCEQNPFSNQVTGKSCIAMLYDINAFMRPNSNGKDLRSINISSLNNVCVATINGNCYSKAFITPYITYDECMKLKNKLGIKTCYKEAVWNHNGEYWAGAVKQCGGVDNMPTKENLKEIYEYLHSEGEYSDMLSKLNLNNRETLFSGVESNYYSAVSIHLDNGRFDQTAANTPENGSYRWTRQQAICIER